MPSSLSSNSDNAWYTKWFDSPYYRILYAHRNNAEASCFIDRLCADLRLSPPLHILDVGCGWGRHACYLAHQGFEVVAIDANLQLINRLQTGQCASRVQFIHHDILEPIFSKVNKPFDLALNLFTSFGYFTTWAAHIRALRHIFEVLRPGGRLILDFMNTWWTLCHLVSEEVIIKEGIRYEIQRVYTPPYIIKDIDILDGHHRYHYRERIWAFWPETLASLLRSVGFEIICQWGDYNLSVFSEALSPRLIYLTQKP